MIPTSRSYDAMFEHTHSDGAWKGKTYTMTMPVEAWTDEGDPMVLQDGKKRLVRASSFSNFIGVTEAERQPVVGVLPGDGWRFAYADDDGAEFTEPVLGWAVTADGYAYPLVAHGEDNHAEIQSASNARVIRDGEPTESSPDAAEAQP